MINYQRFSTHPESLIIQTIHYVMILLINWLRVISANRVADTFSSSRLPKEASAELRESMVGHTEKMIR